MDMYNSLSQRFARELTLAYSSSFGLGTRLLGRELRPHIYNIYGLVRIADEIVDTYQGSDAGRLLDELESDTVRAVAIGYSANPIVQAYALSARQFDFDPLALKAFFRSMRMDLTLQSYSPELYLAYIHGSAEAVGLLCLSVFIGGDKAAYNRLAPGAMALGAAYQKINFLRDMRSDYDDRKRFYFPGHSFESFDEDAFRAVVHDIRIDLETAAPAIAQLPTTCRTAVAITFNLYSRLLDGITRAGLKAAKQQRYSLGRLRKLEVAVQTTATGGRTS